MILALDTSGEFSSAALVEGQCVIAETRLANNFIAEGLVLLVNELLSAASTTFSQLTAVAVCVGPGSYTGVRCAIACAQGLVAGSTLELRAVSGLAALAFTKRAEQRKVLATLPASINDRYLGGYRFVAQSAGEYRQECVVAAQAVANAEWERLCALPEQVLAQGAVSAAAIGIYASLVEPDGLECRPLYLKGVRAKTILERRVI